MAREKTTRALEILVVFQRGTELCLYKKTPTSAGVFLSFTPLSAYLLAVLSRQVRFAFPQAVAVGATVMSPLAVMV